MSQTGEIDPCERLEETAQHDQPLCPNRFVLAIEAVRGSGFALALVL